MANEPPNLRQEGTAGHTIQESCNKHGLDVSGERAWDKPYQEECERHVAEQLKIFQPVHIGLPILRPLTIRSVVHKTNEGSSMQAANHFIL